VGLQLGLPCLIITAYLTHQQSQEATVDEQDRLRASGLDQEIPATGSRRVRKLLHYYHKVSRSDSLSASLRPFTGQTMPSDGAVDADSVGVRHCEPLPKICGLRIFRDPCVQEIAVLAPEADSKVDEL